MSPKYQFVLFVLLCVAIPPFAGCTRMKSPYEAHNSGSTPAATTTVSAPVPKQITPTELEQLRWIQGTWRGTGGDVPTFYERYMFADDSTLIVETMADDTLSKTSDESRFELKDGHFGYSTGDSGSVATALDENSITFAPLGKSRNSFRWQRESADSWKAILNWTDKNGALKERVYLMERWPARKQ